LTWRTPTAGRSSVIGVGVAADHFRNFRALLGCPILLALLCALAAVGIPGGNRVLPVIQGRHVHR
jgi:hypothetical protein